jgi:hypothetical protein
MTGDPNDERMADFQRRWEEKLYPKRDAWYVRLWRWITRTKPGKHTG